MAYTPALSQIGSATLRRLAWFRGKPMSKTLEANGTAILEIRSGELCSKHRGDMICKMCSREVKI